MSENTKALTMCPKCRSKLDSKCELCGGTGACSVEIKFESAANDALAKKCDELEAENADLKCRLDVLHRIFVDYSIESDTTLRDVCARLTHANVELRNKLQREKNWNDALKKENMELAMIRAMLKSRVPVGQSTEHLDEYDGCGSAVSALLSAYDAVDKNIEHLVKERYEQQAKRYAIEQAMNDLEAAWRRKGPKPYDPGTLFANELAAALDSAVSGDSKKPDPVTPDFPSDIKTPRKLDYTSVLSAAERAAGKVSGPAQAALGARGRAEEGDVIYLSDDTRDKLLVAIGSGLSALLKAAAAENINAHEREALLLMGRHMGTVVDAALKEMGL